MPERTLLRIGSLSLILGAVLGLIVNLLHPRGFDFDDTAAHLQEVADSGVYLVVHIGHCSRRSPHIWWPRCLVSPAN